MTVNAYGPLFETKTVTPAIRKAAQAALTYGITAVKAKTPVDTGLLRSQWEGRLDGRGVRFQNNTPYAVFVENGTRSMRARPMLSSTLPEVQAVFQQRLSAELGKALAAKVIDSLRDIPEFTGRLYNRTRGITGFGPNESKFQGRESHMNQRRYGLK